MANRELVIKISEEDYDDILNGETKASALNYSIYNAIRNSTPLPKGHGTLKDADVMINKLCTQEASELFGSTTCAEILDFINSEKPIIKADKGE